MKKKIIANALCFLASQSVMFAALSAVRNGESMETQRLLILLTGAIWHVGGYVWGRSQ